MSHCPFCKKKIAMSKAFCSRGCKENYFQEISIQVPEAFIRNIFSLNEEDKNTEIERFAHKHGWRLDLTKNKVEGGAILYGIKKDPYVIDLSGLIEFIIKSESGNFLHRVYCARSEKSRIKEFTAIAKENDVDVNKLTSELDKLAREKRYLK